MPIPISHATTIPMTGHPAAPMYINNPAMAIPGTTTQPMMLSHASTMPMSYVASNGLIMKPGKNINMSNNTFMGGLFSNKKSPTAPVMGTQIINGQVVGVPMMNGQMAGTQMVNGPLVGPQIINGQLVNRQIVGGQVISVPIFGAQMVSGQVIGKQVAGGQIIGTPVTGAQMASGQMVGAQVVGGQVVGTPVTGAQMVSGQMVTTQMVSTTATAGMVQDQTALMPITGKRRALLIGIDYRNTQMQRLGSGAAVGEFYKFLTGHCNYKPSEVLVLTDAQPNPKMHPNRAVIIKAIEWLTKNAAPGDSFLFYYSGRSAMIQDMTGEELNGVCNSLTPMDHLVTGQLVNADINTILVKRIPVGARLLVLNDIVTPGSLCGLPTVYKGDGSKRGVVSDTAGLGAIAATAGLKLLFGLDAGAMNSAGRGAAKAAKVAYSRNKRQSNRGTPALVVAIGR
ncbi:caspase domain-containing protein [Syncephalis fuscata]|nr:caspase domain-containing protein [Syncephalis fuscata]